MSTRLIDRSPDLKRLRDEGYSLGVKSGFLLVGDIPYFNRSKEVRFGALVMKLVLAGDKTDVPDDHVACFIGDYPCYADGTEIDRIRNSSGRFRLADDVEADHRFSAKPHPSGKYDDYYHKATTYIAILSGPVRALHPDVSPKTFSVIPAEDQEPPFHYIDTSSSRAEINIAMKKLELEKVAILGLGGTGSYVLDFVTKTPPKEIHVFDGDRFLQHNAFRSPGAPSLEELSEKPFKTAYFSRIYSKMRSGIVEHNVAIDTNNIELLREMQFIFLCIDDAEAKRFIVPKLEEFAVPFIDVGMGVYMTDGALGGILRTTTVAGKRPAEISSAKRISFADRGGDDDYRANIQIADLNALNAALAVIKWKKLFGFYHDFDREHHSTYTIDGNIILNDDRDAA
jgi:uncharacterized protein DUF6791/ThiF family protein